MKKLFLLVLIALSGIANLMSQTPEEEHDSALVDKFYEFFDKAGDASAVGDYAAALSYMENGLAIYDASSERFKTYNKDIMGTLYYNIACFNSRLGNLTEALAAFEKAIPEYGWGDYNHALTDPDLDNIRDMPRFAELMQTLRETSDYIYVLGKSGDYATHAGKELPRFTYQEVNDPDLVKVREYFKLDSIAGDGDEISRILNLLEWAHNVVRHDGISYNPDSKNAIDLVEICRREERGINCRMMAQLLNECYLALGFKSRYVTCMPKVMINDCHVINIVYSETLDKWIWVDPTFNAYVTDENGMMLGIAEVRERLRTGAPLVLNEDANWNNKQQQTKEHYLDYYMAKNLYYVVCTQHSTTDSETVGKGNPTYIGLLPSGYSDKDKYYIETSDDKYFWQKPL